MLLLTHLHSCMWLLCFRTISRRLLYKLRYCLLTETDFSAAANIQQEGLVEMLSYPVRNSSYAAQSCLGWSLQSLKCKIQHPQFGRVIPSPERWVLHGDSSALPESCRGWSRLVLSCTVHHLGDEGHKNSVMEVSLFPQGLWPSGGPRGRGRAVGSRTPPLLWPHWGGSRWSQGLMWGRGQGQPALTVPSWSWYNLSFVVALSRPSVSQGARNEIFNVERIDVRMCYLTFCLSFFSQVICKDIPQHTMLLGLPLPTLQLCESWTSHSFTSCPLTSYFSAREPYHLYRDSFISLRDVHKRPCLNSLKIQVHLGYRHPPLLFAAATTGLWITAVLRMVLVY